MTYILTEDHAIDRDGRRYPITKLGRKQTLRETIDEAVAAADRYRSGTLTWPKLYRALLDHGFYGIDRHAVTPGGRGVVAWYDGVRFEL